MRNRALPSSFGRAGCVAAAALLVLGASSLAPAVEKLRFNRDVRPILSEHCYACHGPDKNQRKADLRLDVRAAALEAHAFVPGKADESELVKRIFSGDKDEKMPPDEANKPLSAAQKEILKRWVAEGAEYEGHWAYVAPVRPVVPAGVNGIDFLVEARLKQHGLAFSPPADRRTLIRRLSLDLTGLPPKPAEVEAFVNDKADDAYAKLVERLLASPHYGERMAVAWLDLVRFADTIGYHSDTGRNVYPFRDYVIKSFNENKPFDRFTLEHLAGDLLPGGTQEQKVGSGFNRLLLTTEEGGAQAKDYEARMLGDRVRAVGTVWLGQTLGCCQCHDHKFDPATTRDFYAMGAFFADIQEPIIGHPEPGMLVPDEKQQAELTRLDRDLAKRQQEFDAPHPEFHEALTAWQTRASADVALSKLWTPLHAESTTSEKGVAFKIEAGEAIVGDKNPAGGVDVYRVTLKTKQPAITGMRLEALSQQGLPANGPGRAGNGNFVLGEIEVSIDGKPAPLANALASVAEDGFPAAAVIDGKIEKGNGWAVSNGIGRDQTLLVELKDPIHAEGEKTIVVALYQPHGDNHVLGRFRLSVTDQPVPFKTPSQPLPPKDVADILALGADLRTAAQKDVLRNHFRNTSPEYASLRSVLDQAKKARTDFEAGLPRTLVSVSGTPRTVRILPRGNWLDESGPVMQPALPEFLVPAKVDGKRLTRLDLAQWIVSQENPLTARVFVNRLWKQFFGIGITKTLDDFGSQGEWPSNPELLDWLACEFAGIASPNPQSAISNPQSHAWDIKSLVRTIVLSRAYQQTSLASKELLARDPDNRLVARQGRYRMEGEFVRDNALAVSGLLVPKIGGPSVKQYQPDGYWENLNFPTRTWVADVGENQYRRGLYTWWQRTFFHPSLLAFDVPSREECTADRPRSNIPQQALVLLNDPSFVEAARALAARALKEGGAEVDAKLTWMWQQVLQRDPRTDERDVVRKVVERHLAHFAANPPAAESLLKVGQAPRPADLNAGELAAWTNAARILLNLHETITRN